MISSQYSTHISRAFMAAEMGKRIKVSESPLASAPAFRTLHLKYAVADLQRPLLQAEPAHARFDLEADQVEGTYHASFGKLARGGGQRRGTVLVAEITERAPLPAIL
jgi:hypothetical protein